MSDTDCGNAVRIGPYHVSYFHGWAISKGRAIINVAASRAEAVKWVMDELAKENLTVGWCERCEEKWLVEDYPLGQSDIHTCPDCQPESDNERPLTIIRRATALDIEMLALTGCPIIQLVEPAISQPA
jgi:hypothetical protein